MVLRRKAPISHTIFIMISLIHMFTLRRLSNVVENSNALTVTHINWHAYVGLMQRNKENRQFLQDK